MLFRSAESAKVLDNRRLNKQITETLQIHNTLAGKSAGWRNHPAVLMWRGFEQSLLYYGLVMYAEWQRRHAAGLRGGKMHHKSGDDIARLLGPHMPMYIPGWLSIERLHVSHRQALLFKDESHYRKFWPKLAAAIPGEDGRLPYWWPVIKS